MTPTRRLFLAAGLAASLAALMPADPLQAKSASPEAFLASIYDVYRKGGSIDYSAPNALRRYFAPDLAKLMQADIDKAAAAGEVPALDGDPFIDAQDGDITKLAVKVVATGKDRATGHVTFRNTGEPRRVDLDLIATPKGWRIENIHWQSGTLRELYAPQKN